MSSVILEIFIFSDTLWFTYDPENVFLYNNLKMMFYSFYSKLVVVIGMCTDIKA